MTGTVLSKQSIKQKTLQANAKSGKHHHDKIRMHQQETGWATLLLRQYDMNEVELFTSCYVRQCCYVYAILLELSRGMASHILLFILGAL